MTLGSPDAYDRATKILPIRPSAETIEPGHLAHHRPDVDPFFFRPVKQCSKTLLVDEYRGLYQGIYNIYILYNIYIYIIYNIYIIYILYILYYILYIYIYIYIQWGILQSMGNPHKPRSF